MRINIETDNFVVSDAPRVGNVYPVRGGRGLRYGHLMVLICITDPAPTQRYGDTAERALMLVIDKEGRPLDVTSYGLHYLEDKAPIAFCEGFDDLTPVMRSL